jgi:hypothetical protein
MPQTKILQTQIGIQLRTEQKIPTGILGESRPKRQRPTHQVCTKHQFMSLINVNLLIVAFGPISGTGGMRESLERKGSAPNDAIHLERRVGLFSGVALIVGTMIGNFYANIFAFILILIIKTQFGVWPGRIYCRSK